jgi:hypothetical protein
MSKTAKRPTVAMPTAREDKAIIAAAKADPDALPLTAKQLRALGPMRAFARATAGPTPPATATWLSLIITASHSPMR